MKSLQSLKLRRRPSSGSQQWPLPIAGVWTYFVRLCVPPPHIFEQADHSLHSDKTQSASQPWMLHASSSSVSSQGSPPWFASTWTERVLSLTPPPHSAEHADHPSQSLSWQSTGQAWSLQPTSAVSGGHCTPPPWGCVIMLRVLLMVPPPHVAEHSSSLQSDTAQSMKYRFLPSILATSPRIFSRAHNSDLASFLLSQHVFISVVYCVATTACWLLFWCDPSSFSFLNL